MSVYFCVYVPQSVFVSKPPNEMMSFQPWNSRSRASSHRPKVTFPPPSLLILPINPKSLALLRCSNGHSLSLSSGGPVSSSIKIHTTTPTHRNKEQARHELWSFLLPIPLCSQWFLPKFTAENAVNIRLHTLRVLLYSVRHLMCLEYSETSWSACL